MRTASDDIRAYDAYCDNLNSPPQDDEDAPHPDERIETLLAQAIESEDLELVDLCETVLKQIVQPNLKQQALDRIDELLTKRSGK